MKLVLIAGGSASGKSRLAEGLRRRRGPEQVAVIAHDAYYLDLGHLPMQARAEFNFDSPTALETPLLLGHLDALRAGRAVSVPRYDFATHTRRESTRPVLPRPIVVVEGLYVLAEKALRERAGLSVFLSADAKVLLARRLQRDVEERGRSESSVREQWARQVQPMFERHVAPTREHADHVLDGGRPIEELIDRLDRLLEAER